MLKKMSVKLQALGYFNHSLNRQQHSGINHLYSGMKDRIPPHIWREASADGMAALLIWRIIDAGIVTLDSLNVKGLDAWRFAEERIREGMQIKAEKDGAA